MFEMWYDLLPGEEVILEEIQVKYSSSSFSDILLLTNQQIVLIKMGLFKRCKGITLIALDNVISADIENGDDKTLMIQHTKGTEAIVFQESDNRFRDALIWKMALEDRKSEDNTLFNHEYYQRFIHDDFPDLSQKATDEGLLQNTTSFVDDVAKSVIKSGRISTGSLLYGIGKATVKRAATDTGDEILEKVKKETGFSDLQDEFSEMANEFRTEFGLKRKKTRKEIREEQFQEDFERKKEYARNQIRTKVRTASLNYEADTESIIKAKVPDEINDQIDTLTRLKALLDAGILTPEEFEYKKREVLKIQ